MQAENLYNLLSAKLSGEATAVELDALEQYLHQHQEDRLQVETFEKIWKERNLQVAVDSKASFDNLLTKLKANSSSLANSNPPVEEKTRVISIRRTLIRISAVAASVILIFLSFYLFTNKGNKGSVASVQDAQVVSTRYGSKKKVQLPDGTQVWLNSGSSITYKKEFSKATREVELIGEAFFDVVKNTERPFIIHPATS